jgi:serpin B
MGRFRQGRAIAAIALPAVAIVVAGGFLLFGKHARPKRPLTSLVPAVEAINGLASDLLGKISDPNKNALYSPYSIQIALAMTYAGAAGETRGEMRRVLHYSQNDTALHDGFDSMTRMLGDLAEARSKNREEGKRPITISSANRLFAQRGEPFRHAYLDFLESTYDTSLAPVDFKTDTDAARRAINTWVADRTQQRIRDLVGALSKNTRLVLVNAIYLKAAWETPFVKTSTTRSPFAIRDHEPVAVPTMFVSTGLGYGNYDDFEALTIPYSTPDLQLLVVLPKRMVPLASVEARLTADQWPTLGRGRVRMVRLHMPKFRIHTPNQELKPALQDLGMKLGFDSVLADFSGISEEAGLYISQILHKAFLEIDEDGSEAAAATAVVVDKLVSMPKLGDPIDVHVDRPFLFAIQHRPSGALLFLGRVVDPR